MLSSIGVLDLVGLDGGCSRATTPGMSKGLLIRRGGRVDGGMSNRAPLSARRQVNLGSRFGAAVAMAHGPVYMQSRE